MAAELSEGDRTQLGEVVIAILDSWGIKEELQIVLLGLPDKTKPRHLTRFRRGQQALPQGCPALGTAYAQQDRADRKEIGLTRIFHEGGHEYAKYLSCSNYQVQKRQCFAGYSLSWSSSVQIWRCTLPDPSQTIATAMLFRTIKQIA